MKAIKHLPKHKRNTSANLMRLKLEGDALAGYPIEKTWREAEQRTQAKRKQKQLKL